MWCPAFGRCWLSCTPRWAAHQRWVARTLPQLPLQLAQLHTALSCQVLCPACACAEQVDKLEASVEPTWEGLVQVRGLLPCWWVEH